MTLPDRLTSRLLITPGPLSTPCHVWTGALDDKGYGKIWWHGKSDRVHRVVYSVRVRAPGGGELLDHLCRNRACCNELHLEPVTNKVNTLRGVSPAALHARKTHCPSGHAYDAENTIVYVGKRFCRACAAARRRTG